MGIEQGSYRELAAIPNSKPYVSHMHYRDGQGQSVTLFPAFRSTDTLHDISRIQSPVKLNTVPLITKNQDKWANKYHEVVREYGPPKDNPNSLFLFGKDELYRSESAGNPTLRPPNHKQPTEPPAPMNPNPPPAPPPPPPVRSSSTQYSYTRQPSFRRTVPRMRYIYAFPEEFRDWIARPTFYRRPPSVPGSEPEDQTPLRRPVPTPRRSVSYDSKRHHQYENLPVVESNQGTGSKSVVEELKERINKRQTLTMLKRKRELDEPLSLENTVGHPEASTVASQPSPETIYSATNAGSQFSYRRPQIPPPAPAKPKSSQPDPPQRLPVNDSLKVNSDVDRLLKDTPSHILPIVQSFISTHFDNPQKALDHSEFSETDIPMKHYWQRVFKVKDGKKHATIKIENLLSIEPEIGPFHGFHDQKAAVPPPGTPSYRRVSVDSDAMLSVESGISTGSVALPPNSLEASPVSSASSDMDLLTVVLRKIRERKPIDWPELFLLKNDHCRFVVNREKELRRLRKQSPVPGEAKLLERDIVDNYRCYQRALEQVTVVDELYTKLAYFIMRAESYWYAAKITSDTTLKHHFYALARHNYADLLMEARAHLAPDDRSLLTILDKMTQILIESGAYDPELVAECQKAVFLAEKALESTADVKRERKVIKIKNNLISLDRK